MVIVVNIRIIFQEIFLYVSSAIQTKNTHILDRYFNETYATKKNITHTAAATPQHTARLVNKTLIFCVV